jgi:hypothetical protein
MLPLLRRCMPKRGRSDDDYLENCAGRLSFQGASPHFSVVIKDALRAVTATTDP